MVSSPAQGNITYAGFNGNGWKIVNIFIHFLLEFTFNGNRMIDIELKTIFQFNYINPSFTGIKLV